MGMSGAAVSVNPLIAVIILALTIGGSMLLSRGRGPELIAPLVLMIEIPAAPKPWHWTMRTPITADSITDESWSQFVAERGPWSIAVAA